MVGDSSASKTLSLDRESAGKSMGFYHEKSGFTVLIWFLPWKNMVFAMKNKDLA
jgi:hypothetical protein